MKDYIKERYKHLRHKRHWSNAYFRELEHKYSVLLYCKDDEVRAVTDIDDADLVPDFEAERLILLAEKNKSYKVIDSHNLRTGYHRKTKEESD